MQWMNCLIKPEKFFFNEDLLRDMCLICFVMFFIFFVSELFFIEKERVAFLCLKNLC